MGDQHGSVIPNLFPLGFGLGIAFIKHCGFSRKTPVCIVLLVAVLIVTASSRGTKADTLRYSMIPALSLEGATQETYLVKPNSFREIRRWAAVVLKLVYVTPFLK